MLIDMPGIESLPITRKIPGESVGKALRERLTQKLWLPRMLYESLPLLYLLLGASALGSAVAIPSNEWILPYLLLIGIACLHLAAVVLTLRYRGRRRR